MDQDKIDELKQLIRDVSGVAAELEEEGFPIDHLALMSAVVAMFIFKEL